MKFPTHQAFKKHLQETSSANGLYAVLALDPYERKILSKEAFARKKQENPSLEICSFSVEEVDFSSLVTSFETVDLFSKEKVFILKNIEKASKSFLESLGSYLEKKQDVFLVMEGEKLDKAFYEKLKKHLVVLDLTLEKPWDRKARLLSWLSLYAKRDKKQITPLLADKLYEGCNKDFSLMIQELNKLICFAKEEELLTEKHLEECFFQKTEDKFWNITEAIVFEPNSSLSKEAFFAQPDPSDFVQLTSLLRYHLQIAAKLASLKKEGLLQDLKEFLPNLNPRNEQKYLIALQKFPPSYPQKALLAVFEAEKKSRSVSVDSDVIWTQLLSLLQKEQKL